MYTIYYKKRIVRNPRVKKFYTISYQLWNKGDEYLSLIDHIKDIIFIVWGSEVKGKGVYFNQFEHQFFHDLLMNSLAGRKQTVGRIKIPYNYLLSFFRNISNMINFFRKLKYIIALLIPLRAIERSLQLHGR